MVKIISLSETRGIYDPGSQTFVPTLVEKQYEYVVQFQQTSDPSTVPAPSGSNWVPLFAYESVGGNVGIIYDLRPIAGMQRPDDSPAGTWLEQASRANQYGSPSGASSTLLYEHARVVSKYGELYRLQQDPAAPVAALFSASVYREPSYAPAAGSFQYHYLCCWFGLTPRAYEVQQTQGVLCWSGSGPSGTRGRVGPAGMTLPGIWGNYTTLGDGDAILYNIQCADFANPTECLGGSLTVDGHWSNIRIDGLVPVGGAGSGVDFATIVSSAGYATSSPACSYAADLSYLYLSGTATSANNVAWVNTTGPENVAVSLLPRLLPGFGDSQLQLPYGSNADADMLVEWTDVGGTALLAFGIEGWWI